MAIKGRLIREENPKSGDISAFVPQVSIDGAQNFGILGPDNPMPINDKALLTILGTMNTSIKANKPSATQNVRDSATKTAIDTLGQTVKDNKTVFPDIQKVENADVLAKLSDLETKIQATNDKLDGTINTQLTGSYAEQSLEYLQRIADSKEIVDDFTNSPGSKYLKAGNHDAGFYGFVQPHEIGEGFNGSSLASNIGLSQGTVQFNETPWMKFSWNRKILLIPLKPIRHSISWDSIYKAGAVYGTGSTISSGEQFMLDNDPNYGTGKRVAQNANVTVGGLNYKVRLMKGAGNDPLDSYDSSDRGSDGAGNEWNSLILPLHENAPSSFAYNTYSDTPRPDWKVGLTDEILQTHRDFGTGTYSWCQETRDTVEGDEDGLTRRVYRGNIGASSLIAYTSSSTNTDRGFRPVLELS